MIDSVCDTGLDLGLSLTSSPSMVKPKNMISYKKPCASLDHFSAVTEAMERVKPSLTLSLSGNHHDPSNKHGVARSSSFSNTSLNGNSYSRGVSATSSFDDVQDGDGRVNGRKKLRLSKPQSALLEEAFKLQTSLNPKRKQELARELKLRPRQVEVWFQNRRARTKVKQTEMDVGNMKKLCDKLTSENGKLQKQLQELKELKLSQKFYMQLPAADLAMCPSCEQIRDTKSSIVKNPFTIAAKQHFFNSLTNLSAAC